MRRAPTILVTFAAAVCLPLLAFAAEGAGGGHHGPDWMTLGKYAISFAVVLGLLLWFGGPMVKRHFAGRHDEARAELDDANAAFARAEARLKAAEERLAHLNEEIEQLRSEFKGLGEAERDALAHQGAVLAQKIRDEMDFTLSQAVKMARADLARDVIERAFALAQQRVGADSAAPVRDALVERLVAGVSKRGN